MKYALRPASNASSKEYPQRSASSPASPAAEMAAPEKSPPCRWCRRIHSVNPSSSSDSRLPAPAPEGPVIRLEPCDVGVLRDAHQWGRAHRTSRMRYRSAVGRIEVDGLVARRAERRATTSHHCVRSKRLPPSAPESPHHFLIRRFRKSNPSAGGVKRVLACVPVAH